MNRFILFLGFLMLIPLCMHAQKNPYVDAEFFLSNGEILKGEVDSTFARKSSFKVYVGDESTVLSRFEIDSVHCMNERYLVHQRRRNYYFKKVVLDGSIDLYELNGKHLVMEPDSGILFHVQKNYSKVYWLFCQDSTEVVGDKMREEEFISAVETFNENVAETESVVNNYQLSRTSIKPVMFRVSFYTPSIGVELKLSNSFSFYSDIGLNFFGDGARGAKTFVNAHTTSELRYFFVNKLRERKGKSIHDFTGHYLAASYNVFIDQGIDNANVAGLVYGWQENPLINRAYGKIRGGLGVDVNNGDVYLLSGFSLGWYF